MPSCRESRQAQANSEWWGLETKRIELVHQVKVLEMRLEKLETARLEEKELTDLHAQTEKHRADLLVIADQLRQDLADQEDSMAELRSEWVKKTRLAAVGRTLDSLAGSNGKIFNEVVITRVTDVGVEFRHSTGTARLSADQLSPTNRDAFALDTAVAREAIQEESEIASAYDAWVEQGVAASEKREAARQEVLLAERQEQRQIAASNAAAAASRSSARNSGSTSALREEARPFSNGRSIWYPYYRGYRSYRTRYYYVPTRTYCAPAPYRAPATPSFRSVSRNWTYTPQR
ncbi:hypothetical protein [Luteolibacter flavescens]|nr:hypothetical protein [Luteolibacter flavescens]